MSAPLDTVRGAGRFPTQFERLIAVAEQRGLGALLNEVFRQIWENLSARPLEWGDPYRDFDAMGAVGYGRSILPARIRVEYAVHRTEPIVWISSIKALAGSPFA